MLVFSIVAFLFSFATVQRQNQTAKIQEQISDALSGMQRQHDATAVLQKLVADKQESVNSMMRQDQELQLSTQKAQVETQKAQRDWSELLSKQAEKLAARAKELAQ